MARQSLLAMLGGSAMLAGGAASASVLPYFPTYAGGFLPAATYVPHTAQQLADDPNLANYTTWDIQVVVSSASGIDHFASADMRVILPSGQFYIPPTQDSNYLQAPTIRNAPGKSYLNMDTFVCCPIFSDSRGQILGKSKFAPASQPGPIFPSNGSNFLDFNDPNGTAFEPANNMMIVDVAWGDPQAASRSDATNGIFTIARLTLNTPIPGPPDFFPAPMVVVRLGSTLTPAMPVTATFFLAPEPATAVMLLAAGLGALALRRQTSAPRPIAARNAGRRVA